jgi:hypothetical protein
VRHLLIVSLSRSGGKLLRMLLDGHPKINAFPYEHWNRKSKNEIPTHRMEAFARMPAEEQFETAGAAQAEKKLLRVHQLAGGGGDGPGEPKRLEPGRSRPCTKAWRTHTFPRSEEPGTPSS